MPLQVDGVAVEVALQWCSDSFSDMMVSFVNSVKTIDGGTHIDGLKARGPPFTYPLGTPFSCQEPFSKQV